MRKKMIFLIFLPFILLNCVGKLYDNTNKAVLFLKLFMGDNSPPIINLTAPSSIDDDFELNRKITIIFNENIQAFAEEPFQLTLGGVRVTGQTEIFENCIIFSPEKDLEKNSEYSVLIYGVEDKSGNKFQDVYQFKFKTGSRRDVTPIQVKASFPEKDSANVELNKRILIEFHEIADPKTITKDNFILNEQGTGNLNDFKLVNYGNLIELVPETWLKPSKLYTVTIKAAVKDMVGLEMGSDYVFSFLTITESDIAAPKVIQHFPSAVQDSGKLLSQKVQLLRGESIYPTSFLLLDLSEPIANDIKEETIIVKKENSDTIIPIGRRKGLSSFLIYPLQGKWEPKTKYVLNLKTSTRDLAGLNLQDEFVLSFETLGDPESPIPPPDLGSIEPSPNSERVILKPRVKITFTKPILRPSVNLDSIYIQDPSGVRIHGSYSFENNFTIVFLPNDLLKAKTRYSGFIKTSVRGMGNERFASEYTFHFTTDDLKPPKDFFYGSNFYGLKIRKATAPILPSFSGYITNCDVSPALPRGLFLLNNCTIYGSPEVLSPTTVYTIKASNPGGTTSTRISISVTEEGVNPLYLGYSMAEYKLVKDVGTSINPAIVGDVISCSITPGLPSGLSLNNQCTISGIPKEFKVSTDYIVTANSSSQTTNSGLRLSVGATGSIAGTITVNATVPSTTIWEGIGNLLVTVSLSESPVSIVAVDYETEDGTATAGSDYTHVSGTLYFREGELSKTVTIPITQDTLYEGLESFKFKLLLTLGDSSILGTSELVININDLGLTNDLIAYHPFDGDPHDRVTGNLSTLFGTGGGNVLPQLAEDRKGNPNSAYDFDGTDDYIQGGSNIGISGNSPRTLSVWFKFPVTNPAGIQHPVNWGANPVVSTRAFGFYSMSNNVNFYGELGGDIYSVAPITTNWEHWVATYNSTTVFLYKNGNLVTQANKALNTLDAPLVFGRRPDGAHYCNVKVDELRVYSRFMNSGEVKALYEYEK